MHRRVTVLYVRYSFRLFNTWIFGKKLPFKSYGEKSQYANEQLLLATAFSLFQVMCAMCVPKLEYEDETSAVDV